MTNKNLYVITPRGYPDIIATFGTKRDAEEYIKNQPDVEPKYRDRNRYEWIIVTLEEFLEFKGNFDKEAKYRNVKKRKKTQKWKVN